MYIWLQGGVRAAWHFRYSEDKCKETGTKINKRCPTPKHATLQYTVQKLCSAKRALRVLIKPCSRQRPTKSHCCTATSWEGVTECYWIGESDLEACAITTEGQRLAPLAIPQSHVLRGFEWEESGVHFGRHHKHWTVQVSSQTYCPIPKIDLWKAWMASWFELSNPGQGCCNYPFYFNYLEWDAKSTSGQIGRLSR